MKPRNKTGQQLQVTGLERVLMSLDLNRDELQSIISFKNSAAFKVISRLYEEQKKRGVEEAIKLCNADNATTYMREMAILRGKQLIYNQFLMLPEVAEERMKNFKIKKEG